MPIDPAVVRHVADLARLGLDEEEVGRAADQLGVILTAVDQLQDADTSGIDPTLQVGDPGDADRPDTVDPSLPVDRALAGAANREADLIRVPAIQ